MNINNDERRTCVRFEIPDAVVSYKQKKPFSFLRGNEEEYCPIKEISRGGIGFLCRNKLKMNTKIRLQIEIPPDEFSQQFLGQIKRIPTIIFCFGFRHYLDVECPLGELPIFNSLK